ncbi:MAG TPA: ParA family protein [Trebonia sp.]|jgi:chromosome partitioning protein
MNNATAPSGAYPSAARQTDSNIIAVLNQKGGVGKSMLTMSLCQNGARSGARQLAVDVDPQGTTYSFSRLMDNPGYDFVHETDATELTKIQQLRNYDEIIVDSPGSLEGRDVLQEILKRATYVLIPYDNEVESMEPTLTTAQVVKASGKPYGVVVTKVDPRRSDTFVKEAWELLDGEGIHHLHSFVLLYTVWRDSLKAGVPITRFNARYAPRIRDCVSAVHTEIHLELSRIAPAGAI